MNSYGLLGGPDPLGGMEHAMEHMARLGPMPPGGDNVIESLDAAALRGRGGAAFPVAAKWRSVAGQRGRAVVVVNGAEGEPLSGKDRLLMEVRPHLILDGAALAAASIGAREVILYVGAAHGRARNAMEIAFSERSAIERRRTHLAVAPERYVAGEESAAVHFLNDRVALPTATPLKPFQRGVQGRATLVQNVESLAHAAVIARYGDQAHRDAGLGDSTGSALLTVTGPVTRPGVVEMPMGSTIADAVTRAGGLTESTDAVLVGGYFGGWVHAGDAWALPLDPMQLRARGHSMGCGVVSVLPAQRCGVRETARVLSYLAGQSARQCGPCVFGLGAIAETAERVARGTRSDSNDLLRLERWARQLPGRGACRHPDGAAGFLLSALRVFGQDFAVHHESGRCTAAAGMRDIR